MSRKRYKHKHQQKLFKLSQSFFSSNLDPHKIGSQFLEAQQGRHFLPHPRSLEDDPTTGRSFPLPVAETSQPSPLPPFFWRDASPDAIYAWPLGKWEFFVKFLEFWMEEFFPRFPSIGNVANKLEQWNQWSCYVLLLRSWLAFRWDCLTCSTLFATYCHWLGNFHWNFPTGVAKCTVTLALKPLFGTPRHFLNGSSPY